MPKLWQGESILLLKLTKEPVTRRACTSRTPEPPGSLTWCYVHNRNEATSGQDEEETSNLHR
jgi:hypothetical protein